MYLLQISWKSNHNPLQKTQRPVKFLLVLHGRIKGERSLHLPEGDVGTGDPMMPALRVLSWHSVKVTFLL